MFHKDTLRLIKNTFNRFFSLIMIVLIGIAFMVGLLCTRPIMEGSVDKYSDNSNLHDIQIYSSYGFDEDDIKAIEGLDYVEKVFASRFKDAYLLNKNGDASVARIEEVTRDINKLELTAGRFPEAPGEAVMLDNGMTKGTKPLGGTLSVYLEDDDILESLENDEFKIVGTVMTPAYMAKTLGTGTMKNLDLNNILFVPNENFKSEYYTSVYITLKDAAAMASFGKDYEEFVSDAKEELASFARTQQEKLKQSLLEEYRQEIEDGEAELIEKKAEGQQQLDDAKVQLEDARIQLISGESQIQTLETAINTLLARQKSLEKQYAKDIQTNTKKIEEIEAKDSEGRTFEVIFAQVTVDNASKITLNGMLNTAEEAYKPAIRESIKRIDSKYPGGVEKTFEEYSKVAAERTRLSAIEEEITLAKNAEKQAKTELAKLKKTIKAGRKQYEEGVASYEDGLKTFNEEIEKAEIEIRKAYQKLEDLPDAKWILLDRTSHYSTYMYKANASQMGAIGIAMPILFFLVAALVCLTTMTRLIDEQRGQIGVFRALGFSKLQIISKYVFYTLAATVVGSIVGMALGMAIFPPVIYTAWRLMYDLPAMQIIMPLHIVLLCFFSFAGLMTAVTVYVVNRTLSDVPSQLMRPKAPKSAKPLLLEKVSFIWNRLGFTSKITARNLLRYKGRALMTIIGVAGCTGLLVVGWGIKDSVQDIVSIQFGEIYNYDYIVSVTDNDKLPELMDALNADLSNEQVAPYMSYSSKVYLEDNEPTINVVVLDAREGNEMMNFRDADSKKSIKLKNSGVFVNKKFAINNGISEGDYITIESKNGLKQQVKVAGIMELYFQHYIYISEDYYKSVFDENIHHTNIAIRNAEKDAAQLELLIKDIEGYESLTDFSSITAQFTSMLSALNYIILVIIVTAGALAFVVLINLTQVNISERIREIATLKVLGFHDSEVNSYIFKEVFLLSVIGAVIGMPLGIVEHKFIMNVINMEMIMFGDQVKIQSFIYAFAVTVIFTVIVLLLTRKSLRKIEMIESLKSVE